MRAVKNQIVLVRPLVVVGSAKVSTTVPGDRVDLILTHEVMRNGDAEKKERRASETILTDVRVLAIDQKMEEVRNGDPVLVSVVTLEVSPDQAQRLIYSAHEGNLQLALRNPSDRDLVATRQVGAADVLKSEEKKQEKPKRIARNYDRITVIKGTKVTTERF